jgi:hypothetical protein
MDPDRLSWTKKPLRSQVDTATCPNGLSDFSSALIHSASASTTKKPLNVKQAWADRVRILH